MFFLSLILLIQTCHCAGNKVMLLFGDSWTGIVHFQINNYFIGRGKFENFQADRGPDFLFLFIYFLSFIPVFLYNSLPTIGASIILLRLMSKFPEISPVLCGAWRSRRLLGGFGAERFQDCAARPDKRASGAGEKKTKHLLPHLFAELRDTRSYLGLEEVKKKRKKVGF